MITIGTSIFTGTFVAMGKDLLIGKSIVKLMGIFVLIGTSIGKRTEWGADGDVDDGVEDRLIDRDLHREIDRHVGGKGISLSIFTVYSTRLVLTASRLLAALAKAMPACWRTEIREAMV